MVGRTHLRPSDLQASFRCHPGSFSNPRPSRSRRPQRKGCTYETPNGATRGRFKGNDDMETTTMPTIHETRERPQPRERRDLGGSTPNDVVSELRELRRDV